MNYGMTFMVGFIFKSIARNKKSTAFRVKTGWVHGGLPGNYPAKVARSRSKIPKLDQEMVNKMLANLSF